jgi:hypothetical protein
MENKRNKISVTSIFVIVGMFKVGQVLIFSLRNFIEL